MGRIGYEENSLMLNNEGEKIREKILWNHLKLVSMSFIFLDFMSKLNDEFPSNEY